MLIKVFDKWINPSHISKVEEREIYDVYCSDVSLIGDSYPTISFYDKRCDQVAEEINKQLKDINHMEGE